MPVYLCKPGADFEDPWRHGIQVYAAPVAIEDSPPPRTLMGGGRDLIVAYTPENKNSNAASNNNNNNNNSSRWESHSPIRRVRHAEVVLVDDVCIAHDRYWLRLRWPGQKGGFAGYIAMGLVSDVKAQSTTTTTMTASGQTVVHRGSSLKLVNVDSSSEDRGNAEETDVDDPIREEEPSEIQDDVTITCFRTGLTFQSSSNLTILPAYEDGLHPPTALIPADTAEPVFCRICREGMHDDADDEQPSPTAEADDAGDATPSRFESMEDDVDVEPTTSEPMTTLPPRSSNTSGQLTKGPIQPHPLYTANPHALENPLLAPCECSGSMAFVHYLCVEQWRCRSRHPAAQNGLACETCGGLYALPPPSARPAIPAMEHEDWLEAMPPHVMQALRQPHICWQVGAALVRRRWIRPLVPVFMSPLVALYCRARRLLKKRGVARRRWACSLCRRRARWKCVRCLRSYYCSRQCQNVSWHIVHKHVCYKPVRFWWSVVAYGTGTLLLFPGITQDPLLYDLGLCFVPTSFIVMGVLGGGIATVVKRATNFDLRGRILEFLVVLWTLWLTVISWQLIKAFFGNKDACIGMLGKYEISEKELTNTVVLRALYNVILSPAQTYYLTWDRLALNSRSWLKAALCSPTSDGCFSNLPHADADFFFVEHDVSQGKCASDLLLVVRLYLAAAISFVSTSLWKRRERDRRRRRPMRNEVRPHQD